MNARVAALAAYIEAAKATACTWGLDDCSMFAGRWVERARGISLDLPSYPNEARAREMIATAGGLAAIWDGIADRAGVHETGAPQLGDVGLIHTRRFGPVGVIFAQDGIALWRAAVGLTVLRPRAATILKAWAV